MAKKVTVAWSDPVDTTNADHVEVWRKTGSGGTYAQIGTDLALGVETYEDTNGGSGLTDSTQYYYDVRVYNSTGSYVSTEANITISAGGTGELFPQDNAASAADVNAVGSWVANGTTTISSVGSGDTSAYDGSYCIKAVASATTYEIAAMSFSVTNGTSYTITAWAKRGSVGTNQAIGVGGGVFTASPIENVTTTTWTLHTFNVTANATGTGKLNAYATYTAGVTGSIIYIDLVSITEV